LSPAVCQADAVPSLVLGFAVPRPLSKYRNRSVLYASVCRQAERLPAHERPEPGRRRNFAGVWPLYDSLASSLILTAC